MPRPSPIWIAMFVLILATVACGGSGNVTPTVAPVAGKSDETLACIMSQDFIERQLKAPASAKYPNCVGKAEFVGDGEFVVTTYVDSQNSFGAMIRTSYVMRLKSLGADKWRMLSLVTDP
jgi:hypothetical protein